MSTWKYLCKMGLTNNKSREYLIREAESVIELVNDFDDSLNLLYEQFFLNLLLLSTYIYCDVSEKEALEAKFFKYDEKFKKFCKSLINLRKLEKVTLSSKENNDVDFEIICNYEEDGTFLDRNELNRFVEYFESWDESVNFDRSVCYDHYIHLTDDAEELNNLMSDPGCDIKEADEKLTRLKGLVSGIEVEYCNKTAKHMLETLARKNRKYASKYYREYIMRKQETFEYTDELDIERECVICLEEFVNKDSVTKLRCGHVFCTGCIEKWFASENEESDTCPFCKKSSRHFPFR